MPPAWQPGSWPQQSPCGTSLQPRWTLGRARHWGQERAWGSSHGPLHLQHSPLDCMDAEEQHGPGHLFHTTHTEGSRSVQTLIIQITVYPHILSGLGLWAVNTFKNGEEEMNLSQAEEKRGNLNIKLSLSLKGLWDFFL